MLKKGYKPNTEPTLSIGMILPTDLRKQLIVTIPWEKKKISIESNSEYLEYENSKKKVKTFIKNSIDGLKKILE